MPADRFPVRFTEGGSRGGTTPTTPASPLVGAHACGFTEVPPGPADPTPQLEISLGFSCPESPLSAPSVLGLSDPWAHVLARIPVLPRTARLWRVLRFRRHRWLILSFPLHKQLWSLY
ncbi:hypothetical protein NDU88_003836 [Pleurodeles waltl]|uniref:Uncharacterized protein n=1 Tax=Pleurodeles waltl TaxID=8319 RepID=A0AAV7QGQ9_PLEWA|nr:hypothetical protein NDU88_003836 [Pleurodeles waltl]